MITVIVLLILAGVSLNAIIGENGIITNVLDAKVLSKYSTYKEELETYLSEDLTCADEDMKKYMKSMSDEDIDKFIVWNGKLYFIGDNEYERKMAESVGIDTSLSGLNIDDLKALAGSVLPLGGKFEAPKDDNSEAPDELIGTRLYDKVASNNERWDVVIDYNESNEVTNRFGTGYYYLAPGEYEIDDKRITLRNGYIIDYNTRNFLSLSERHIEWNIDSTVSTRGGLVLNLDPMNLADGEWKKVENKKDEINEGDLYEFREMDYKTGKLKVEESGIYKAGDIEYNEDLKTLDLNLNTTGEMNEKGGYLKIDKEELDFNNGFSFEIFFETDFSEWPNKETNGAERFIGLFCRAGDIMNSPGTHHLRFALKEVSDSACIWGKFFDTSSWKGQGFCSKTGDEYLTSPGIFQKGTQKVDICFTYFIGRREIEDGKLAKQVTDFSVDTIAIFINGKLKSCGYYGHDSYEKGLTYWNSEEPFYIGSVVAGSTSSGTPCVHFLRGKVYCCRLYNLCITDEQAIKNYELTLKYLNSF